MAYTKEQLNQIEFKNEKSFLSNMYPCKIKFNSMEGFNILNIKPICLL